MSSADEEHIMMALLLIQNWSQKALNETYNVGIVINMELELKKI